MLTVPQIPVTLHKISNSGLRMYHTMRQNTKIACCEHSRSTLSYIWFLWRISFYRCDNEGVLYTGMWTRCWACFSVRRQSGSALNEHHRRKHWIGKSRWQPSNKQHFLSKFIAFKFTFPTMPFQIEVPVPSEAPIHSEAPVPARV